jgi:endonuclease YncB( thermonuclease family)
LKASPVFVAIAIVTASGFANAGSAQQLMTSNQTFSICGSGQRVTCVVDGDTFWLRGTKVRIADIDTPELSPPRCERERQRGMAAKQRLLEILNSGPLSFKRTTRDEDRFGRKFRSSIAGSICRRHPYCRRPGPKVGGITSRLV